jgi:Predicted membrane protein
LLPVFALFAPVRSFALYAGDPASGLAACGCCGTFVFIPIAGLALSIALLVWVARDAKARGMDSAVLWMLLVFFLNLIGLVIYLFARPQGNLIPCPNCGNNRLQASVKCPHCGMGS